MKKTILTQKIRSSILVLFVSTISGCETYAPQVDMLDDMDQILAKGANQTVAEETKPNVISQEEASKALMADISSLPAESQISPRLKTKKAADQQRFDISVSNVPVSQFYMSLVEGTKYNIVVHPKLEGLITLTLKNVTVLEVMQAVRDVYGYEFEKTGYGIRVLPDALESRIFQVDYLNVQRQGVSSTSVSTGTLTAGVNGNSSSNSNSGSNSGSNSSSSSGGNNGTSVNTVQPLTSFWSELELSVKSIIGVEGGRNIVISPDSGLIVVRATPNELRDVERYLEAAQFISHRQVILETKILEVELNDSFRSGVNWSLLAGAFTTGITGGADLVTGGASGLAGLSQAAGDLGPNVPLPATGFGGIFSLAVNSSKFNAFLELLETQGSVQVLSSPRISTMNNQKAVIKVGQDEFFVTDVSSDSAASNSSGSNSNIISSDIELTPFFSGIALDVTPQISKENEVTLHIHPSISRVSEQTKNIVVNGQAQDLPLAVSVVRESDSIIRANSGQIVVIGGLMQDTANDVDAKTPGIANIPFLGEAFKQKSRQKSKSELIILLRPVVIDSPRRWSEAIDDSRHNFGEIRDEVGDWKSSGVNP